MGLTLQIPALYGFENIFYVCDVSQLGVIVDPSVLACLGVALLHCSSESWSVAQLYQYAFRRPKHSRELWHVWHQLQCVPNINTSHLDAFSPSKCGALSLQTWSLNWLISSTGSEIDSLQTSLDLPSSKGSKSRVKTLDCWACFDPSKAFFLFSYYLRVELQSLPQGLRSPTWSFVCVIVSK